MPLFLSLLPRSVFSQRFYCHYHPSLSYVRYHSEETVDILSCADRYVWQDFWAPEIKVPRDIFISRFFLTLLAQNANSTLDTNAETFGFYLQTVGVNLKTPQLLGIGELCSCMWTKLLNNTNPSNFSTLFTETRCSIHHPEAKYPHCSHGGSRSVSEVG